MDRFDRIYALHRLLSNARLPVSRRDLERKLECSRASVKRIIDDMRNHLNAPIEYDRERNGYYFDHSQDAPYELPGLWFRSDELYALLAANHLLTRLEPGLLEPHIAPLRKRIDALLRKAAPRARDVEHRVRIVGIAQRTANPDLFRAVAAPLFARQRLRILYHSRGKDEEKLRTVSPQRLTHYRDNWYLDAWCHSVSAFRSFALDRIRSARVLVQAAREFPESQLEAHYASA